VSKADKDILRVLDVNFNRAKEGLRVIEDTLRLIYRKKALYLKARALRHKLSVAASGFYDELVASRASEKDPGRKIKEASREDIPGILKANIKRVQESSRVLEEYSKLMCKASSQLFKSVRFGAYDIEKGIFKAIRNINAKS
jgi:hypothetical protein